MVAIPTTTIIIAFILLKKIIIFVPSGRIIQLNAP